MELTNQSARLLKQEFGKTNEEIVDNAYKHAAGCAGTQLLCDESGPAGSQHRALALLASGGCGLARGLSPRLWFIAVLLARPCAGLSFCASYRV